VTRSATFWHLVAHLDSETAQEESHNTNTMMLLIFSLPAEKAQEKTHHAASQTSRLGFFHSGPCIGGIFG